MALLISYCSDDTVLIGTRNGKQENRVEILYTVALKVILLQIINAIRYIWNHIWYLCITNLVYMDPNLT